MKHLYFLLALLLFVSACKKEDDEGDDAKKEAASELMYTPSSMTLTEGEKGQSVEPTIKGSAPFQFDLITSPSSGAIHIDVDNGIISSDDSLQKGSYSIEVLVSNSEEEVSFPSVYRIDVEQPFVALSFDAEVKPLISAKCASCHTSGPQAIYTNYDNAKNSIDAIISRVKRTPGSPGFMPQGAGALTMEEIGILEQWKEDGLAP